MFNNDQNDENVGATDEGDEDDFAPGTTCLTSPGIEQFSEDERENKIKPQRMYLTLCEDVSDSNGFQFSLINDCDSWFWVNT